MRTHCKATTNKNYMRYEEKPMFPYCPPARSPECDLFLFFFPQRKERKTERSDQGIITSLLNAIHSFIWEFKTRVRSCKVNWRSFGGGYVWSYRFWHRSSKAQQNEAQATKGATCFQMSSVDTSEVSHGNEWMPTETQKVVVVQVGSELLPGDCLGR